jgi:molybdenum cofactor cytidylyltransferase
MLPLDVLILAAGEALRFGSNKLLAPQLQPPLLSRAIQAAQALGPEQLWVIGGAYGQALEDFYAQQAAPSWRLLLCPDWHLGLGHSLAWAVRQRQSARPLCVLLADQPGVSGAALQRLQAAWAQAPEQIACAAYGDTLGAPAIFPAVYQPALGQLQGDRGAQVLIRAAAAVTPVDMPEAHWDIDTPNDLQRWCAQPHPTR